MTERTIDAVLTEFRRVYKIGRAIEQEYMDRPTEELERKADRLEKHWDKYLSNTTLTPPRSSNAIAAKVKSRRVVSNKSKRRGR